MTDRSSGDAHTRVSPSGGWWARQSKGIKGLLSAVVTGVLLLLCTGPLGPVLQDLGSAINPFEEAKHEIRVVVAVDDQQVTQGWLVAKPLRQIGQLPAMGGSWSDWETRENAVRANKMSLSLSLQGGSAKVIILTKLEIQVVQRRPPVAGTWVAEPGAGDVHPRFFMVDLDDPSGRPKPKPFAPASGAPPGRSGGELTDFPYQVSESDVEQIVLFVNTDRCDCEWKGMLHWTVDGRTGTTEISDNGKAFRLTSAKGATEHGRFNSADPQPQLSPAPK